MTDPRIRPKQAHGHASQRSGPAAGKDRQPLEQCIAIGRSPSVRLERTRGAPSAGTIFPAIGLPSRQALVGIEVKGYPDHGSNLRV